MRRREVIMLAGGAGVIWPLAAHAQQPARLPTIGFLGYGPASQNHLVAAFVQRLRELGWVEGRTIIIEYRWAEGRGERAAEIAAEFARLKVDVVLTSGAVNILAARQAAPSTPIVFAVTADPVGTGLVASLARPGGTITGLASQGTDYAGKQIEILRELIPSLSHVGIMFNAGSPGATGEMRAFEFMARKIGLDTSIFELRKAEDIAPAFEAVRGQVDALDVVPDPLTSNNRIQITAAALAARCPAIYGTREFSADGGLLSFGPNLVDLYRRSADFVDKILRGTKPMDIPVEQPTKFDVVINLKTAKALGLEVPARLLAQADEIIE